jgi:hypothetical protein
MKYDHLESVTAGGVIRQPKHVADITICGSVTIRVDDTMNFIKPTHEQIKNLHDLLCIDVKLAEED